MGTSLISKIRRRPTTLAEKSLSSFKAKLKPSSSHSISILTTLCWQVSRKIGWIACREYKTMQLVLSLADEGETMQSLCSDLCQSELGLSTRFPPCAIVAEIHLLLLTSLICSQSINLPALCVLQTLVS